MQKPHRSFKLPIVLSILALLVLAGAVGATVMMSSKNASATNQVKTVPYSASGKSGVPQGPARSSNVTSGSPADSAPLDQAKMPVGSLLGLNTSGGGCYSYTSSSPDATVASNGSPQLYGFEGKDAPMVGLTYNRCNSTIIVTLTGSYDYYNIDWWRPGRSGWTQYWNDTKTSIFSNAWAGTYYQFVVQGCYSHWYGDSCKSWSPRVNIYTN